MPNQFSVDVPNVLQGIVAGEQGYKEAKGIVDENRINAGRQEAMNALQTGGDLRSPLAKLIGVGDIKGAEAIAAFAKSHYDNQGVYGTPIYGTENGKSVLGAIDKMGGFRKLDTGGVEVNPGVKVIDTPQGGYVIQSRSGQPIGQPPGQHQTQPQAQPQPAQPQQMVPPTSQSAPQGVPQPGQPQASQPQSFYPKDYVNTEADKVRGRDTGQKQAEMGKAQLTLDTATSNLDRLAQQANELKIHPGLGRITGMTGMLPNIPGFPGADAEAKRQTLLAQSGFGTLQQMREASKTGGALGSVTEVEHKLLQNYLAELTNAQTETQMKAALDKIIRFADESKGRLKEAYNTDYAGIQRQPQNAQPGAGPAMPKAPAFGEVRQGYRYKGGDPADQSNWVKTKDQRSEVNGSFQVAGGTKTPKGAVPPLPIGSSNHMDLLRRLQNADSDQEMESIRREMERRGLDTSLFG